MISMYRRITGAENKMYTPSIVTLFSHKLGQAEQGFIPCFHLWRIYYRQIVDVSNNYDGFVNH